MNKQKIKSYFKGFTLVELIIVITILAILATIAFISFKGYTIDSRDASRLSALNSMEKGLNIFLVKSGVVPTTNSGVTITASGTTILYQGNFSDTQSKAIGMSTTPLDPLDKTNYIYSTNANNTKFQIMGYLENTTYMSYTSQAFADDLTNRKPKTFGNTLGIILDSSNNPIQSTVDVVNTNTSYKAVIKDSILVGTGGYLKSISVLQDNSTSFAISCNDIKTKKLDFKGNGIYYINPFGTGSFQVYCDMITDGGGWTAFYGVDLLNVSKMGALTIPGNSTYGEIGTSVWSSNLKNMTFSGMLIAMYNSNGILGKTYKYNLSTQTGFILSNDSSFNVDNIIKPEPDCRFWIRYRGTGWTGIYNWEVGINDIDNGALDASCAVGVGVAYIGVPYNGNWKETIRSSFDDIKYNKSIFYIK